MVAYLDADFRGKPFGAIGALLAIADAVTKLGPRCAVPGCAKQAVFSKRLTASPAQVLLGGADAYMPVCREHFA